MDNTRFLKFNCHDVYVIVVFFLKWVNNNYSFLKVLSAKNNKYT